MAVVQESNTSSAQIADGAAEMEALIREHQRMIFALCFRMTGSIHDAEDLAQETFIQACRSYDQFRGDSRVSSWLYRIAMNRCLNWQTRKARTERLHRDYIQNIEPSQSPAHGRTEQVNQALQKLNPKQRAAIVLTVYEGLNHAEAARVLGCSETTVSWRIFVARRQLKKWLKNCPAGGSND